MPRLALHPELLGCAEAHHYTDTIRVTDTVSGSVEDYHNPPGSLCGGADTAAFAAM